MTPNLDLQLQVAIKALTDTILPALDPSQRVAAEQLHLTVATLSMVRQRLPLLASAEWQILAHAIELARAIVELAPNPAFKELIERAATLLTEPNPAPGAQVAITRQISARISDIVRDPETSGELLRLVVSGSEKLCDYARAWCLPGGFETDPADAARLGSLIGD